MGRLRIAWLAVLAGLACRRTEHPDPQSKALNTLGYLASMPVGDQETEVSGVMRREPSAVAAGITIICDATSCNLIDMSGRSVHRILTSTDNTSPGTILEDYDESHVLLLLTGVAKVDWLGHVEWE